MRNRRASKPGAGLPLALELMLKPLVILVAFHVLYGGFVLPFALLASHMSRGAPHWSDNVLVDIFVLALGWAIWGTLWIYRRLWPTRGPERPTVQGGGAA